MVGIKLSEYPELLKEWDYEKNSNLNPLMLTDGSNRKVYWICPKGHSYGPKSIYERTRKDGKATNCPFCANKKVLKGFNDLETWCKENNRKDLLADWDYSKNTTLPSDYVAHTDKKPWWICSKGHSYQMKICEKTKKNPSGCPICSNNRLLVGYNDLKTLFPDIAKEWDYELNDSKPEDYIAGTHTKANWICSKCGYKWIASIKERAYHKTNCPNCTHYFKTSTPEQAVYFYVKQVFNDAINSYKTDYLKGKEIDIYIPSIKIGIEYDGYHWHKNAERDKEKSKILKEHGIKLIRIKESDSNNEYDDYAVIKSNYRDNIYDLDIALKELFSILNADIDINVLRDSTLIYELSESSKYEKSLLASNSIVLKEWDYEVNGDLTPDKVTAHSRKIVNWKCSKCGKSFKQSIKTKVIGGLMCESCSKTNANKERVKQQIKDKKIKSVADYPKLLLDWNDERNPSEVASGSESKAKWKCHLCGHEFNTIIKNRTKNGYNCPNCHGKRISYKQIKLFE